MMEDINNNEGKNILQIVPNDNDSNPILMILNNTYNEIVNYEIIL